MKKEQKYFSNNEEFLAFEFKSKATIIDDKMVEVIAPDGEIFELMINLKKYKSDEYRYYQLHTIRWVFDLYFSEDKELMTNQIWNGLLYSGVNFVGMSSGSRQSERIRIGKKIRTLREEKSMEARDLAKLAKIDAANLSRIEQGKFSVGLDILSKIAFVLGCEVDIVPKIIK